MFFPMIQLGILSFDTFSLGVNPVTGTTNARSSIASTAGPADSTSGYSKITTPRHANSSGVGGGGGATNNSASISPTSGGGGGQGQMGGFEPIIVSSQPSRIPTSNSTS